MSISIQFTNDANGQPAVYFDRPDLDKFTLAITSDSATPVAVPSVRIRLPVKIFAVGQAARVTVAPPEWGTPVAAGPFLTLTPTAAFTVSKAAPLVIRLAGVVATGNAATNDDVQVFVGSEAPTAKIFLMRYPAEAGDLVRALKPEILPAVVYRTPSDFDRVENVVKLRLTNLNPAAALVTAPWVRRPTVQLSFVYGNDIGSLTPADPPVSDPHSVFNVEVDVSATYKDGKRTYEWSAVQPETGATDTTPVWTLQPVPENTAVLGAGSGATAEFRISGLSTSAPAGSTLAYLQFSDFPGYSDTYISVPLDKQEPRPAVVYFDGVPNYVAALGDEVTLEWQTFAMARVELQVAGKPLDGPIDAARGTRAVPIDRTTDFALLAFKKASGTTPEHTKQWTAHVPDAQATFTADRTTVADGSPVVLSWTTRFARAAEIASDTRYAIPAAALKAGTHTYYPRKPTTYTLKVTGQGDPPAQQVSIFVLKRGWAVRPMGFSPNAGQGPVLYGTDGGLVLVGGQSDNAIFQSADGSQWDQVGVAAFPARNDAAGCAFGGKLWIMGGVMAGGRPGSDVWSSDDGITWTQATAAAPWPARSSFACAEFGGKLWIFGGRDQNFQPLGDIWSSADGVAWTQVAAGAPRWKPRSGAAVAVHGGKLWLFGGQLADRSLDGDLWSSADGTTWSVESGGGMLGDGPAPRQGATLASLGGGTLYLFGGVGATGAALDDLQLFDGGGWELGTGPSSWNVSRAGFATWRGAFWFAGGRSGNAASDAVWSWFPEQGT